MHHSILFEVAAVLVLGVGAQWLAWRLGLPSILLLLSFGFLAGPITGLVETDALLGDLLQPFVSASVGIILFEGGLSLRLSELGEGRVVRNLVTIGAIITWVISTLAALWILGLSLELAALLGAILVVSGPTVIFPMIRHIRPKGETSSILKWEGILIDPIGATFAVLVFETVFVAQEIREATSTAVIGLVETLTVGGVAGIMGAVILIIVLRRYWVPEFLETPVTLMLVIAVFDFSDELRSESGLFAATMMGIIMANQPSLGLKKIIEFKETLGVLLISSLFILLAARIKTSDIEYLGIESIAFVAVLIFIARPLAIFVSTYRSRLTWQERVFLSWMAPRGIVAAAVSSIFALELAAEGYAEAERLVPMTFMVIVGTVVIYGLTAGPLARWLGLAHGDPQGVLIAGAHTWARDLAVVLQHEGFDVMLVDTNHENVVNALARGLPSSNINILSHQALEEVELSGLGRLIALTPNNEVNSLAALQFVELFGRSEVYRLSPEATTGENNQYGRWLFNQVATYNHINALVDDGATIQTRTFKSDADIAQFRQCYTDPFCIPMFLTGSGNSLVVVTAYNPPTPRIGQKMIYLAKDSTLDHRSS
ncbi:MAG: cation:proton antiporter [Anaerolineales bacterium]|nr:cation:proton antiporter [Anaerolineales bacterium]